MIDSEDPKFSFGARQLEKGASEAPEGMERAGIWDENGVRRPGLRCYGFFLGSPEYVRHKLRGEADRICTEIDKVMHLLRNDLQSAWAILSSALAHQLDYSLSLQYPSDSLECAQITATSNAVLAFLAGTLLNLIRKLKIFGEEVHTATLFGFDLSQRVPLGKKLLQKLL